MPKRFLNSNKKVSISQVNLKLFFEFYREYICPFNYNYLLEDNKKIIIKFEENAFPHLLGLHKFDSLKRKNKENILDEILTEKITLKKLQLKEATRFKDDLLRYRLMYFPVLKTLLENPEKLIVFDEIKCFPTKIKCDFLVESSNINLTVYLAIIKRNNDSIICYPVSFLVDKYRRFSELKLEEIKIKDIIISNKIN